MRNESQAAAEIFAAQKLAEVNGILAEVCRITGMRFAALARVSSDSWIACQVVDAIDFGIAVGDSLVVADTVCGTVHATGQSVLIEDIAEDPDWRDHPSRARFGFRSALSVPVLRPGRGFFGTLCAADPAPRLQRRGALMTQLEIYATRIGRALDRD